jgi:hypothetical protein
MRSLTFLSLFLLSFPLPAQADCSGGSSPTGKPCGVVGFEGCCKEGTLYFCEGGELCALSCEKIPGCGWDDAKGLYDCGTGGSADPGLEFPLECPAFGVEACQGVDYGGCCAGSWVYWCDGKQLQGFDCGANSKQNECGINPAASVADCVLPGGPGFKSCPFVEGEVIHHPDIVPAEVGGGDAVSPADIHLTTDGLVVPDIDAPSKCATLARRYDRTSSSCDTLGPTFLVLQEGCAALLVGMVPALSDHPAAKVTQTGLAFDFPEAGLVHKCTAQHADGGISGQCFWGEGGSCEFAYGAVAEPEPEAEGGQKGGGGGCAMAAVPRATGALLFILSALVLLGVRRVRRNAAR